MSARLDDFARRLGADRFFLAAALECFAASENCDDGAVAARLGCPVETLTHLRLCRMPRPKQPFFWQDVQTIASRFSLDAEALAEVVRHGQSILQLRSVDAESPRGKFMAARDRSKEESDDPEPGNTP
ncbi:MAG: hypothetical protein K2R98_34080 [Gemmataceae bacterium]|nr:hypothetical protein [Gemmataceae bacterium]